MAELDKMLVLKRRRALEDKKDDIASAAIDVFTQPKPSAAQLQGLRTAAASTDSVKEVKIFIQYQIGRGQIKPGFGEALLTTITEWQGQADPDDPKLYIEMVRQFLGNVVRYGKYQDYLKKQEEQRQHQTGGRNR